ncbi:response regulator [Paracoccus aestuarii]|uniref:histidine kinase n=1 Tax=Paracoccus aestuarii TaxID=453842 RepID=A0A419A079_9RHOB|nr:ATP-binding protein [Paracoccus aestuarii]RJL06171.1 response regulator [Paracoccus aestuarii]WCQ98341.1 response regulator [Paracoccus aestuarii]
MIGPAGIEGGPPRMSRLISLLPAGLAVAVVGLAALVWVLQMDARQQIEEMGTAATDSTQWFLAQSEIEAMTVQRAALNLKRAEPDQWAECAADLRRRFDIFYSRIQTLRTGRVYQGLRDSPGMDQALDAVAQALDGALPAIDGDDARLVAALPELEARIDALVPLVRQVSLEGVRLFAQKSEARRQNVGRALTTLSLLVVPLFIALLGGVLVLLAMVRSAGMRNHHLAEVTSRLQSLFEASIDAILVARPDGRIVGFNAAAQRIYGYSPAEAIGGDMVDLLTPRAQHCTVRTLLAQVRDGQHPAPRSGPEIIQATARHKSGRIIPIELSISIARGKQGPLIVAFVRDVSRRAADEAELIEARDRAVAGERAKARMIAVMSHEMRTPLNGVLGLLDLLRLTPLNDRQQEYLGAMEHSGRMLLRHVNDVLDASRARGGRLELAREPVDLRALISGALDGMQAQARAAGNRLVAEWMDGDDRAVMADAARLEQIIVNLVGNAIKFTENGTIRVELDRSAGSGQVEIRVIDTGSGIPAGDIDRIFDEFVTLGSTFDRRVQGTGLGLSIVKGLVDAMGGQIDLESEPGQGTAFRVLLPLTPVKEAPRVPDQPMAIPAPTRSLSVLLVEDNAINRLVAREMMARQSCTVTEAEDGILGVERAMATRYDIILMDISMPRMNGIEAARRIRAEGPNRDTPIIALTAHAMPEDLESFRAAGMDRTLVKPLSRADLAALLDGLRPVAPPQDQSADLIAALGPEGARALLDRIRAELTEGIDRLASPAGPAADRAALAHRLAGSAAVAGLRDIHQALNTIQQALLGGRPIAADLDRLTQMLGISGLGRGRDGAIADGQSGASP